MLSSFAPWCAETCISASEGESQKPHQGFAGQNPILHRGIEWSKSTFALGLPEWAGKTASGPAVAANNGSRTPKICGGTFEFGGLEADVAEGGVFTGVIHEHDSIDGNSVGNLTEGWGGGEVVAAGGGKITTTGDKSTLQGFLGFVGLGASAGPLAGIQIGYATGKGWGGLYVEGHLGHVAWGGGGYLRTSCKAGG